MKRLSVAILVLFVSFTSLFSQTYYVSSSSGSDNNDGLSETSPWKTIKKINSKTFKPGDNILFKSGDVWRGEQLGIDHSGTAGNQIIYSTYGTGLKPIITLREELPAWTTSVNWTAVSGLSNVWRMSYLPSVRIKRMWFDGVEYLSAASYNKGNVTTCPNGVPAGTVCYRGENYDPIGVAPNYFTETTYGINTYHRFYVDVGQHYIYVYSIGNPATYYSSIQYPGKISGSSNTQSTIYITDDYITLYGLDIRGGMDAAITTMGADYLTIDGCALGRDSGNKGIDINIASTTIVSDSIVVKNCTIDPNFTLLDALEHNEVVTYGIRINGVNGAYFLNNYIKNWKFGLLTVSFSRIDNVFIYNNEITAPDIAYGKPIETGSSGDKHRQRNLYIYNNYMHDLKISFQLSGTSRTYIYYNIFDTFTKSLNSHTSPGNSGFGVDIVTGLNKVGTGDSVYIFNNTFYNINNHAIRNTASMSDSRVFNNLIVNAGLTRNLSMLTENEWSHATHKNNLFFRNSWTSSNKLVYIPNIADYTLSEWDAVNGTYDKTISGNLQYVGSLSTLINTNDFSLPTGSPALNAGIDISSLVPEGFTDRFGNVVNKKNPNIGAVNNTGLESTGFNVYLQGSFVNGEMKTDLKENDLLPKSQPYNILPWNYTGDESVSALPSEIVDWVLVELRSDIASSSIAAKRAAFVKSDGNIVDLDGISKVSFNGVSSGNYYIVIRHRNHLSIMSANKVALNGSFLSYDFTTSRSTTFGNDLAVLGNGKYGMYAGDGDANGTVNVLDYGTVGNNLFQTGYLAGDYDLNGTVNVLDYAKTNQNLLKVSNVP